MVWVGGLEGERGSGETDQGEHNLALPRIVQSRPDHLKILKTHLQGVPKNVLIECCWRMVHRLNRQWLAPLGPGKCFFGRFLLRLGSINLPQVISMVQFSHTTLNFGYDFVLHFLGHPVGLLSWAFNDYEGGLLDRILGKVVQQRFFCASKIIRLMFAIVFISFSIYCTNQIVGKNIRMRDFV